MRRPVRTTTDFWTALDAATPAGREPSWHDVAAVDLPDAVERFATSWEDLLPLVPGRSDYRVLIGSGRVVAFVERFALSCDDLLPRCLGGPTPRSWRAPRKVRERVWVPAALSRERPARDRLWAVFLLLGVGGRADGGRGLGPGHLSGQFVTALCPGGGAIWWASNRLSAVALAHNCPAGSASWMPCGSLSKWLHGGDAAERRTLQLGGVRPRGREATVAVRFTNGVQ